MIFFWAYFVHGFVPYFARFRMFKGFGCVRAAFSQFRIFLRFLFFFLCFSPFLGDFDASFYGAYSFRGFHWCLLAVLGGLKALLSWFFLCIHLLV